MSRPVKEKIYIFEKRTELIWALDHQGYDGADIALMFGVNRSTINRILKGKPLGFAPKWVKKP